jgi:hypothetical protein
LRHVANVTESISTATKGSSLNATALAATSGGRRKITTSAKVEVLGEDPYRPKRMRLVPAMTTRESVETSRLAAWREKPIRTGNDRKNEYPGGHVACGLPSTAAYDPDSASCLAPAKYSVVSYEIPTPDKLVPRRRITTRAATVRGIACRRIIESG